MAQSAFSRCKPYNYNACKQKRKPRIVLLEVYIDHVCKSSSYPLLYICFDCGGCKLFLKHARLVLTLNSRWDIRVGHYLRFLERDTTSHNYRNLHYLIMRFTCQIFNSQIRDNSSRRPKLHSVTEVYGRARLTCILITLSRALEGALDMWLIGSAHYVGSGEKWRVYR